MNILEIKEPRYKDNTVLLATWKIKAGYNYVRFTEAKHLKGKLFRLHSTDINTNSVQQNGRGLVYIVPMEKLELVEDETQKEEPKKRTFKIDIGGVSKEFDNADAFCEELAKFLSREE